MSTTYISEAEKTDKEKILTVAEEITEILKELTPQQQSEAFMLIKGVTIGAALTGEDKKSA